SRSCSSTGSFSSRTLRFFASSSKHSSEKSFISHNNPYSRLLLYFFLYLTGFVAASASMSLAKTGNLQNLHTDKVEDDDRENDEEETCDSCGNKFLRLLDSARFTLRSREDECSCENRQ